MVTIKNKNAAPWIDSDVITASREKEKAYKKAKKSDTKEKWDRYKYLRNRIKNLVSAKYKNYLVDLSNSLSTNPKRFWNFFRTLNDTKGSIPDLKVGGQVISDINEKANSFNKFFHSVFNTRNITIPHGAYPMPDPDLCNINLTEDEVLANLKNLNPSKAQGPDGIPMKILKDSAVHLAKPITKLFNKSLEDGTVPSDWKRANVSSVFKKGDRTDPSNYRPVSLLPMISKILERCIYDRIIPLIAPKLTAMQFGFLKGKSTVGQMLQVFSKITEILDNKDPTDMVYLDLSKAFDSVPHKALLHKLHLFGVGGQLLKWLESYLSNRLQRVVINGGTSDWLPVTSGVPQGSILGPLLFLIYINDLPDELSVDTRCAIFADDTKIYRAIKGPQDIAELQKDIQRIYQWGDRWGLTFNPSKCNVITIQPRIRSKVETPEYKMGMVVLEPVVKIRDLGICVDEDISWSPHIGEITKKAKSKLWLIIRNLGLHAPIEAKRATYLALVRSILEFSSPLWSPHKKEDLYLLEGVQRWATNYFTNNKRRPSDDHIDYKERLMRCNLLPLSYRREMLDITFFLKSYHGKTGYTISDYLEFSDTDASRPTRQSTHGCSLKLKGQFIKTKYRDQFYPSRLARIWNSLPPPLQTSLRPLSQSLVIRQLLRPYYMELFINKFDTDDTCSWINFCRCPRCRTQ